MKTTRRAFVGGMAATVAAGVSGSVAAAKRPDEIRAVLLHLGTGMWWMEHNLYKELPLHRPSWRKLTEKMAAKRMNMVLLDIGEGLVWPSHPELAYKGALDVETFRRELARLRSLGLEPIPKLNFSTTHNFWLGEARRWCSTSRYYRLCDDLVRDAAAVFDAPRFLHIGFDEEKAANQSGMDICISRNVDLWYHDLNEHVRSIEKAGMRAMMWSDYGWHNDDFVRRCPKSVVQNNWYYDEDLQGFDPAQANAEFAARLNLFLKLDKAGFEQIPCGSTWRSAIQRGSGIAVNRSMAELVAFCRDRLDPKLLKGFLMAPWEMCHEEGNALSEVGVDVMAEAMS